MILGKFISIRSYKNYKPALLSVLVLVVVTGILFLKNANKKTVPRIVTTPSTQKLDKDNYDILTSKLNEIVYNKDPRTAINQLKNETVNDSAVLASCHEIVHQIGHSAYNKYQDFAEAMSFRDPYCTSGYTHGVIEQMLSAAKDVEKSLINLCKGTDDLFLSWECHHGVGHGLMYFYSNDVPVSIEHCVEFDTDQKRSACANGVFMEHFNKELDHQDNLGKIFDACRENKFKTDCYINSAIGYFNKTNYDYKNAASWCQQAESEFVKDCYQGLGAQATRRNLNDTEFLDSFCLQIPYPGNTYCTAGVVSTVFSFDGDLGAARSFCEKLSINNKPACSESIKAIQEKHD